MGFLYDSAMIAELGIDRALTHHIEHRLYPRVPMDFKQCFWNAIEVCALEDDDYVELPNGKSMLASEIVDEAHLEAFVLARSEEIYNSEEEEENENLDF